MPTIDLLIKKIYRNVFMIEAKLLRLNSIRKNNSLNIVLSDNDERAELYEIMTIKHLIIKVGQTVPKVSLLIEMKNLLYKFIYIINLITDLKNYFSKRIKMHLGEFGHFYNKDEFY